MGPLLLTALLLQTGDAVTTCHALSLRSPTGQPLFREANPLMGSTCRSVVTRKALFILPAVLWQKHKWAKPYTIGLAIGGGVGMTVNVVRIW